MRIAEQIMQIQMQNLCIQKTNCTMPFLPNRWEHPQNFIFMVGWGGGMYLSRKKPRMRHEESSFSFSNCYHFSICAVLSHSVMSNSLRPHGLCPSGPSVGRFSRQEYWSGLPCPPPGDLLDPGIEPRSPAPIFFFLPYLVFFSPQTRIWSKFILVCK